MPFFERGAVRIHYREAGRGFPLFIINGGGLNSVIDYAKAPFDTMREFEDEYRCICMDLRNANGGLSTGPLDVEGGWDAHTQDQLALLDYLGVGRFLAIGYCIGNPLIWNLIKHVPQRVVAAVLAQPSAVNPRDPGRFVANNLEKWVPGLLARRPDITMDMIDRLHERMYAGRDFVLTVDCDFVRRCDKPLLVLPDDTLLHPYEPAMKMARIARDAQVSFYPWKETEEGRAFALRHVRTFLRANRPF